ncbi:MAG: aminotransferase class V-fold PLP-dependent enzyme [Saprospiraceae bacterium]|nr:aminotransferase class V-fold PLP-dependent enzyme [Saprospiraceae bacterium]
MINRRKLLQLIPNLTVGGIFGSRIKTRKEEKPSYEKINHQTDNIYTSLGVKPLINARGTVTIIGATQMLPEVKAAMDAASRQYVQIDELMEAVGQRLADLTGAEWGFVSSGASAAITFGTVACITGGDPDKLWQVPDLTGMKDEVIIPSYSRTAYECAARSTGVKMIPVSDIQEFEAALGPRTAMILVLTGKRSMEGPLSLQEMAQLARPLGVPILADAAAEELVVPNPHLRQGADLVAYSGGKCMRGPQCAGLLLGRKDLVEAARLSSAPHHGFGRGYKVGREEIIGMLTAVEMWFQRDHVQENQAWTQRLKTISDKIQNIPGLKLEITQPGARLSNRFPNLQIHWDRENIPLSGYDVENILWDGNPRIAVSGAGSFLPFPPNMNPDIQINPSQMQEGEAEIVAERLNMIFSNPPDKIESDLPPDFDITGQWDLQVDFAASTVAQKFIFEQNGNALVGTHFAFFASRDLTGSISGNNILVRSSYTDHGVRLNFEFTGTVSENKMEGQVSLGEYGLARWKAVRKKYGNK